MVNRKVKKTLMIIVTALSIAVLHSCGTGRNAVSRGMAQKTTDNKEQKDVANTVGSDGKALNDYPDVVRQLVDEAYTWLGTRYVYGGHSKKGTDCSGMIMEIFLKIMNLKLPRASHEQQAYCASIDRNSLNPGDLIFFKGSGGSKVSHVGLFIGDNKMIHASTSKGVIVSNIYDSYYDRHYHSSGHIRELGNIAAAGKKSVKASVKRKKQAKGNSLTGDSTDNMTGETNILTGSSPSGVNIVKPADTPTIHIDDLDNMLQQKTDSILSTFMD